MEHKRRSSFEMSEIPFPIDTRPSSGVIGKQCYHVVSCFFPGGKFEAANKAISLICRSVHISEWQRYVFSLSLSLWFFDVSLKILSWIFSKSIFFKTYQENWTETVNTVSPCLLQGSIYICTYTHTYIYINTYTQTYLCSLFKWLFYSYKSHYSATLLLFSPSASIVLISCQLCKCHLFCFFCLFLPTPCWMYCCRLFSYCGDLHLAECTFEWCSNSAVS